MKKILGLALIPLLMLAACKRDITSINIDPKRPSIAPAGAFFSNAQRNMSNLLTSTNVNTNIFRLVVQYWQETTYTDESNYDITTRQQPAGMWNTIYRDVIRDLREAKSLIPEQVEDAAIEQNQLAIAEIQEVFAWYYLVTSFGDVPYTEALNIETQQPKYDKQDVIFKDLLTRLDAAIGKLNTAKGGFGDADLLYGDDVAAWKKFAQSFKLKMAMTIADALPDLAKTTAQSAIAAGVFTSNDDNAVFHYLSSPPNTNPVWVDLVQSGRKDFVAASTIINVMDDLNDPRMDEYFTLDAAGGYSGGQPGASSNYATFSKPDESLTLPDAPATLLSYAEVEFFLAEYEQRWGSAAAAATHYYKAIDASFEEWTGNPAPASYKAQADVVYNPANWRESIGMQKWIALYNRGWDEWIEWRRLDYPELEPAADAVSEIPLRFTYPIPEQNLNTANREAAAASIGGDDVETQLFWDKF